MRLIQYAILLLASSGLSYAGLPEWQINPEQSELTFTATQNAAPLTGTFKHFSGEIFFDPAAYQKSSIRIVVDMNSVSASYADLVKTLLTSDWFDVKKFPTAEYQAKEFTKKDNKNYEAKGTLRLRDKTLPLTLSFTVEETAPGQDLVEGNTKINRTAFGVGQGDWSNTKEIKDEVAIHFKIKATRKDLK